MVIVQLAFCVLCALPCRKSIFLPTTFTGSENSPAPIFVTACTCEQVHITNCLNGYTMRVEYLFFYHTMRNEFASMQNYMHAHI